MKINKNYFDKWCVHAKWLTVGSEPGKQYKVFLKSGSSVIPKSLDVFISLIGDSGRYVPPQLQGYFRDIKPLVISWEIDDGGVCPALPKAVMRMLRDGLSVGWGCLGGHGRTGWLAAKIHQMLTNCDGRTAVRHVRTNYCKQAIETNAQLRDLGFKPESNGIAACGYDDCHACPDVKCMKHPWREHIEPGPFDGATTTTAVVVTGKPDTLDKAIAGNPDCVLSIACSECQYVDGKGVCYFAAKQKLKIHYWCDMQYDCIDCSELGEAPSGKKYCKLA